MSTLPQSSPDNHSWLTHLILFVIGSLLALSVALPLIWWGLPFFNSALPLPALYGDKTAWYLARATGTVAYLLLSGSTIWGLLLSTKIVKETVPAPLSLGMHSALSWWALALSAFHGFVLLFDGYYDFSLANLLLPFGGPYRPFWVGLGIIGFYLVILTSFSFRWRRQLGSRNWRRLHYLTFVAYLLVTLHGLVAGTDSSGGGMRLIFLGSALLVLFLTNYRLISAMSARATSQRNSLGRG